MSRIHSICSESKVKRSSASRMRPVPATTPNLRVAGSLRPKTSNTHRRWAVPSWSAASSMVSSYISVRKEDDGEAAM